MVFATLCLLEVTSKHNDVCQSKGNVSGFTQNGVATVPAWHLRQSLFVAATAVGVLASNA
jgi:hypothetical protein